MMQLDPTSEIFSKGYNPRPARAYNDVLIELIAGLMDGFTVVVTKSTVPVGTGDEIEAIIRKALQSALR